MRKQYHFWPAADGPGHDAWDVHRLIDLSRGFKVAQVAVDSIWEVDTDYWSDSLVEHSVRRVLEHMRAVLDVDTSYPIILGYDGRLMDGMHRVCRAILDDRRSIDAVRFASHPEPDYRNCDPNELR
jgi:hypothetical protein